MKENTAVAICILYFEYMSTQSRPRTPEKSKCCQIAGLGTQGFFSVGWMIHKIILDSKLLVTFLKQQLPKVTLHLT